MREIEKVRARRVRACCCRSPAIVVAGLHWASSLHGKVAGGKNSAAACATTHRGSCADSDNFRGYIAKIEAETQRRAASPGSSRGTASRQIQRVYRGYVGREEAKQVRRALEYEEQVRAAKLLQRCWRESVEDTYLLCCEPLPA